MQKGDFATIDYIARTKDTNKVFDTTMEEVAKREGIHSSNALYGPVTIVVGAHHVIPGLEKALVTMDIGEENEVDIEPEDAFGKREPQLVTTVPLKEFRKHRLLPRPGMRIEINDKWATVRSVSSGRVSLDFNHPLSGKAVHYTVKILGKVEDTTEKVRAVLKLLGLRGKVTSENEKISITLEGLQQGAESKIQDLVRKEIEKYVPEANIEFNR